MKFPTSTKPRPKLTPKAAPSPVVAAPKPKPAPSRASSANRALNAGPYSDVLNSLDKSARAARDVAGRRQRDNEAYTAWQQSQQSKLGAAALGSDQAAARANLASQIAAMAGTAKTQSYLAEQRAERTDLATTGSGNATQGLGQDAALTQALIAGASQQQASAARSSQQKAGFLQAAVAAAGQANSARIAGESSKELSGIEADKRTVLTQRESDRAAAATAAADREQKAADAAANRDLAASRIASSENIAAANIAARAQQGHLSRVAAGKRAKLGGAAGGVSASETRQRANDARTLTHTFEALKSAASSLKGTKTPYSAAKQQMLVLYPDLASNSTALNAALSAIYDPKAKGGKPRGKAYTDYKSELSNLRKGK